MSVIKISYGIVCRRGPTVLLVKKPLTYHFCEFMSGHYPPDAEYLRGLFSNMTYHEKANILKMPFECLWRWVYNMPLNAIYAKKKNKFDQLTPARLAELMHNTPNVDLLWEAPKGRKNPGESDQLAAVREFQEESGLTAADYELYADWPPIIEQFEDLGVTYKNIYWLAEARPGKLSPPSAAQHEVVHVAYVGLADIQTLHMNRESLGRLTALIRATHRRFKAARKLRYV